MKTTPIADLLGSYAFFADFTADDVAMLAGCARNETFAAGARLAREGEPADRFFLVREGRVAIEIDSPGRGTLVVETLGAGDIVGWSWLFAPHRWSFDVEALEEAHVVEFDGACLRGKCDADPALGYRLMTRFARVVSGRLEHARIRLLDLYGGGGAG